MASAGGGTSLALAASGAAMIAGAASAWSSHAELGCALLAAGGVLAFIVAVTKRQGEAQRLESPTEPSPIGDDADSDRRRLSLMGTLAAGIGHELGQPLSAARVGIEGLHYLRQLGREPSPEHINRTLSQVGMSLIAMTQTIEHLRALSGPSGTVPLRELDLAASVDAVLAERSQWLRYQDIEIGWKQPGQPVPALGDQQGLRLILTNLLRNAVEAVAGQTADRRSVRVTVGPGAVVAVHDAGGGIAADHLQRLFDPFFSTKGGPARGIGLSLARASAERMGAELTVSSAVGSGTTFT
ncbi:MAG: hypothetical protein H0W83_07460, partial [Planctomycetes bacterium]|nr:hypothetical protein [Planctomycetota bacterium]